MITAKVIGAGGYGGVGIIELLLGHPEVELKTLVEKEGVGKGIHELYPHLAGFCELSMHAPDDEAAAEPADITFFATPDRVGMVATPAILEAGGRVIDYSGDFRFSSTASYRSYAERIGLDPEHASPDLLSEAVYGLAEVRRDTLTEEVNLVGNAGCFAVACILGLAPAAKYKLVDFGSLICDAKSGVSGAGKKVGPAFHYPARYEQMNAYRLTGHQHVCEIELELSRIAGADVAITFTPQVVPACRGILACLYGTLADGITESNVMDAYNVFHKSNRFVRIFDRTATVGTMEVRRSNYCNLVVDVDERTNRLRVISCIDNLMKGQASNALQNMNILFGFPETTGLSRPGGYP